MPNLGQAVAETQSRTGLHVWGIVVQASNASRRG
jgi:hypothetical protein